MRPRSLRSLAMAALAVAVVGPTPSLAQHDFPVANDLLTMFQREIQESTQWFAQLWDSAVGQQEEDTVVILEVVEKEEKLTDEEKAYACRVAVERVDEQAALQREAKRMTSRLRTPLGHLVTLQFEGETSCDDLSSPALVRECTRVAGMDKEIAAFLRRGKTHDEICAWVDVVEDMTESTDPQPLSCKLCKRFVQMVTDAIKKDMAQVQQVREILGDICDSMSADSMCHTFLKHYDDVVQWLVDGTNPQVVCQRLTMCAPVKDEMALSVAVDRVSHACFYCEHISGAVAFVMQHAPNHLETLHSLVKFACKLAPKDCKCSEISTNFGKIVDWTKQGKTPEEICTTLGFCKKELSQEPVSTAVVAVSDDKHGCFYCEHLSGAVAFVIQHAPDQLNSLRNAIKLACKLAPKDCKCEDFSANFDKIVDWTKQGKTPEEICIAIGMCKKGSSTKMLGMMTKPKLVDALSSMQGRDGKKCFYCEYFTTLLEIAIQEDEQDMDEIRQYADMICGFFGDNKYCREYVSRLDTAIDDIKQGKKPREICTDMQFCTKIEEAAQLELVTRGDDKQCFYCDYFVTILEIVLQHDEDEVEQIRQYADIVCGMLGDDNICHQYMDKFDAAVAALKQGKKPREICTEFKFCTKFQKLPAPMPTIVNDDKECFYCDYFVTILEVVIQEDKADIDQVREFADMICGMLGDDNVCHQYVDKLDTAIDGLRQGKKPREVCIDLKFCTKKNVVALEQRRAVGDKKCLYCEYFVTILEVFLVQDDTDINMVREYADMICGMLGDDNVCHQYVDKFDIIVDGLKSGKQAHDICVQIKSCTKAQVQALALPLPVASQDNKTCFYCDYFTTILEVALQEDPDDVDGIVLYAEILCGMLGEGNTCHKYLDQLKYAIDALKKGKKPRQICAEFKYCSANQIGHNAAAVIDTPALLKDAMVKSVVRQPVGGSDECFYCTQVADLVKIAIDTDPSKVAEIRNVFDLVCKALPADNKCHAVLQDIDRIIDSIKKGDEPMQICQNLSFCEKAKVIFSAPKPVSQVKDNTCAYCDGIATVLEYALKTKPDQVQQLREAAGIVCDFMPQDDKCHDDLKMFDKAVESLKAGKSPHSVCVDANLCHDKAMPLTGSKLMPSSIAKLSNMLETKKMASKTVEVEKSMSMGCLLCEYTAEALVIIKGDASELRLAKQALETMCIVLPPSARCDVLSSKFDELVDLVGKGKSPSQACNAISFCDAAFVEPSVASTEPKRVGAIVAEQ